MSAIAKLRNVSLAITACLIIVIALIQWFVSTQSNTVLEEIEHRLNRYDVFLTEQSVASISLIPIPSIKITQLVIKDKSLNINVENIALTVSWSQLVERELRADSLSLNGVEVSIANTPEDNNRSDSQLIDLPNFAIDQLVVTRLSFSLPDWPTGDVFRVSHFSGRNFNLSGTRFNASIKGGFHSKNKTFGFRFTANTIIENAKIDLSNIVGHWAQTFDNRLTHGAYSGHIKLTHDDVTTELDLVADGLKANLSAVKEFETGKFSGNWDVSLESLAKTLKVSDANLDYGVDLTQTLEYQHGEGELKTQKGSFAGNPINLDLKVTNTKDAWVTETRFDAKKIELSATPSKEESTELIDLASRDFEPFIIPGEHRLSVDVDALKIDKSELLKMHLVLEVTGSRVTVDNFSSKFGGGDVSFTGDLFLDATGSRISIDINDVGLDELKVALASNAPVLGGTVSGNWAGTVNALKPLTSLRGTGTLNLVGTQFDDADLSKTICDLASGVAKTPDTKINFIKDTNIHSFTTDIEVANARLAFRHMEIDANLFAATGSGAMVLTNQEGEMSFSAQLKPAFVEGCPALLPIAEDIRFPLNCHFSREATNCAVNKTIFVELLKAALSRTVKKTIMLPVDLIKSVTPSDGMPADQRATDDRDE